MSDLLARVPDEPRWVEARGVLLSGRYEVFGDDDCCIHGPDERLIAVVGRPSESTLRASVERADGRVEILVQQDDVEHVHGALPEWKGKEAVLHSLPPSVELPDASEVRLLDETAPLGHLSVKLRDEIQRFRSRWTVAAVFADRTPVSFCTAATPTETLYDLAIETVEPYRRRGFATRCASFLIRHMRDRGKEPVWGALEENAASMKLAARLGFEPTARITLFVRS